MAYLETHSQVRMMSWNRVYGTFLVENVRYGIVVHCSVSHIFHGNKKPTHIAYGGRSRLLHEKKPI